MYIESIERTLKIIEQSLQLANVDNLDIGLADKLDRNVSQLRMVINGLKKITDEPKRFSLNLHNSLYSSNIGSKVPNNT